MSGYSLGRQAAGDPGTPTSDSAAFQPFWDTYHSISDRYAGGAVDQDLGHPGRHPRDDRFARRPVLRLPVRRRLPQEPAGHQRPVRGDRRRDHVAGRRRDGRLHAARARLPARGDPADPRLAGRDRRRHARGHRRGGRRRRARRPRRGRRPATGSAARRARVVKLALQRDGRPVELAITRDVVQEEEVETQGAGGRHRRLRAGRRASRTRPPTRSSTG